MNVYSDSLHTVVDFLYDKALNISNLLYMEEDFNIRDAECDLSISSYLVAKQVLRDLADSYSLVWSIPVISVPTYYLDIQGHANIVINLIFLGISYVQVSYCIKLDLRQFLDHTSFIVDFPITPENIYVYRMVLKYDSKRGMAFLLSVSEGLS